MNRNPRQFVVFLVAVALVGAVSAPANAVVYSGSKNISCTSTSYSHLRQVFHMSSGPMSFWNDGSGKTIQAKRAMGSITNFSTLASGTWVGWTTAQSPIGYWDFYARISSTTESCSTFPLAYSIVYKQP